MYLHKSAARSLSFLVRRAIQPVITHSSDLDFYPSSTINSSRTPNRTQTPTQPA